MAKKNSTNLKHPLLIAVLAFTILFILFSTFYLYQYKSKQNLSYEGKFCGGIGANLPQNQCPSGYKCQLDGNYPDASGTCIKKGLFDINY